MWLCFLALAAAQINPQALYESGQRDAALSQQAFEKLLKIAPESAYVLALLGEVKTQDRQYTAALYAYTEAAKRMPHDLVNPNLEVEAVGFAPWQGHWLGVVVTPWFMNVVLLPRTQSRWQSLRPGDKRKLSFPAGIYEFIAASDPGVGEYQSCSLFSPMQQFESHEAARLVAQLARQALLDPANAEPAADPADARPVAAPADEAQAISKRDFLRGRFADGGDGD